MLSSARNPRVLLANPRKIMPPTEAVLSLATRNFSAVVAHPDAGFTEFSSTDQERKYICQTKPHYPQ